MLQRNRQLETTESKMSKLLNLWRKIHQPKTIQKAAPCNSSDDCKLGTEHPLNIFPEVVWLRIADYLNDNADILNLINSSQFFRNLLYHERVTFLFKPAFEILVTNLVYKNFLPASEVKSVILNCRLVCHSWADAIERLCQHNWNPNWNIPSTSLNQTIESIPKSSIVGQVINNCFDFSSSRTQNITKFIWNCECWDFIYPHTIFGQGIKITMDSTLRRNDALEEELFQTITIFLANFGQYFSNCHINFYHDIRKLLYLKIVELLRAMKNLQNLHIRDMGRIPCNSFECFRALSQTQLSLKYLKRVELCKIGTPLCNTILCDALQINKLCIKESSVTETFTDCKVDGLNLVDKMDNKEQFELCGCTWENARELSLPSFPVKRFYAQLTRKDKNANLVEFFGYLSETFGETLEELMVAFGMFWDASEERFLRESHIARLNLPKVKKISLAVMNQPSFDFLLGTTESLEFLHICVDSWELKRTGDSWGKITEKRRDDTIKIWSYHNKMNESNIWKLFPKLKTVELTDSKLKIVGYRKSFSSGWHSWKWIRRETGSGKFMKNWIVENEYEIM